jgi:hypothetical protein
MAKSAKKKGRIQMSDANEIIRQFMMLPEIERVALADVLTASVAKAKKPAARKGSFTPNQIAASSSEHVPLLMNIMATARRFGFVIDPGKSIDPVAMDAALKGADVSARLALKATMAKIGLIP